MGDRGATGGAWGARDDASWWSNSSGELQQQQQINEEIARSTATATHQLYTYKMAGGFSNSGGDSNTTPSFDYRLMTNSNTREETAQQPWWYASGSVDNQQSSPTNQNQSSPDSDQGNQQANGVQSHQTLQQHQDNLQQQNQLQQHLQQQQNLQQALQQQSLQQMLQQQQQQEQSLEQNTQIQVSQAQAQAIVQAQAALQQQVAQSLQQQQQNLHDHIQAVQQQQIQAALQRQSATLQELQQQAQQQATQTVSKGRMPRARAYNKPRGRMTAYAFFVQTCREEHKKKHPEENVVFAAFSKKCAERWNIMSEKEKERFHEMADQDKKRYDLEMQNYVPPKEVKTRGRKRQHVKDPNAPKRSLSAFFWFCNDERSKVKATNPEYTMGDIAKELGRRWAAADAEIKSKYEALSEQDKARYDREMTAYKKGPLALVQQPQVPQEIDDDVGDYEGEDEYK